MNIITYAQALSQAGFEMLHTKTLLINKGSGLSMGAHFPKVHC